MHRIEIEAAELARRLEAGDALQLLDVRAPERLASGSVDIGPPELFFNRRGSEVCAAAGPAALGLDPALPIVTICGHGNDSRAVAEHLNAHGANALSLAGGMRAWMHVLMERELQPPPGFDAMFQYDRLGKGSLAYLFVGGDEAIVVDAPRATRAIEERAERMGARIAAVAETHVHADYISGGHDLAARLGVPYYLHPADGGQAGPLGYVPIEDGQALRIGAGQIRVEHTPGHTAGSVCYLAGGSVALTGDLLFVDSVGRPDLAGKLAEWTEDLFASLARLRRTWPNDRRVYPAHYASASERNRDRSVGREIGDLRLANDTLDITDPQIFHDWVASHVPSPPAAYRRIRMVNLRLLAIDDDEADELEGGRNECALS